MAQISQGTHFDTYINELPYSVTRSIISSLDSDKAWESLASEAGYTFEKIKLFELEYHKCSGSPAKALLWDWGSSQNTTVKDLYYKLKKINRLRELNILENYLKSVGGINKESDSNSSNNSISFPSSLPPSDLPRPSQKNKVKAEKTAVDDEVNFNQPHSQVIGGKANPLKSLSSVDKEKHYDDKVIPGQEQITHHKPQASEESFSSSSFHKVTSPNSQPSSYTFSSDSSCDFKSLISSGNMNLAVAMMGSPIFTFDELSKSTGNFDEKNLLGEGAFGKVYYSRLRGSKCAIKKLDTATSERLPSTEDKSRQLCSELSSLLKYRHENIVTLYGYAVDGSELCLVYQYMINGSLDDCLHLKNGRPALNWEQRLRILSGAACGLRYLHLMGSVPLIHGDIKSANILLDKYYEAKLGDLGQAQHVNSGAVTGKLTHITKKDCKSKLYGTRAYLSPELLRGNANMSIKTDIYAFGVVILETCSGLLACDENRPCKFLADHFMETVEQEGQDEWVEKFHDDKAGPPPTDIVFDVLKLAVSCVSQTKKKRPETDKVAESLEEYHTKYMEQNGMSSDSSNSINCGHISHTSMVSEHAGNMASNVPNSKLTPETPPDLGGMKSIPYQLQQLYDQKRTSSELHSGLDDLKHQVVTGTSETEQYVSDPKKMAEIEKYDKNLKIPPSKKTEDPELTCDPHKLAQLKLFDEKGMVSSDTQTKSKDSDEAKLRAILEFDAQNVGQSQKEVVQEQVEQPDNLESKRNNFFKLYEAGLDDDDCEEDEEGEDEEEEEQPECEELRTRGHEEEDDQETNHVYENDKK